MNGSKDSNDLAERISSISHEDDHVEVNLSTDEKVIARITDGIYRQPASALRELISNAYDADATRVIIDTDYPRFEKITIRDDGIGMSSETLANMVLHIGGSAKRDSLGVSLGITSASDSTKTVSGRNIIGKIGIGLFSVAQLTQQFQIITKVRGEDYRLVANVTLKTFTEESLSNDTEDHLNEVQEKFRSGKVTISKVKAFDIDSQGTDIVLHNLRKNALSILKSEDIWTRDSEAHKPVFHIGEFVSNSPDGFLLENHHMSLPWEDDVSPEDKFFSMYRSLLNEYGRSRSTPSLENTFDNYFQMLWALSLSSPISYIDKHPFKLNSSDEPVFFILSNKRGEQATEVTFGQSEDFNELRNTVYPITDPLGGFDVFVDGIRLFRPLAFNNQKKSDNALKDPLMFYGKYQADFSGREKGITGGALEFEAYFFWNSKILPLEHNGIAIRINNASGTLFDSRWLGYAVAEKTTLGQISAEIFVIKGLDAALNIDRESFNYAHPHYQVLSKWVHNALRQITKKQKDLRAEKNQQRKVDQASSAILNLHSTDVVSRIYEVLDEMPRIYSDKDEVLVERSNGRSALFVKNKHLDKDALSKEKFRVIVAILYARGLLEGMSYEEQESLVGDIASIYFGE